MFLPLRLIPVPVQCVVLTTVFDLYLRGHPDFQPHLEALEGRCCRIYVRDSGVVLFLRISHQGIKAKPEYRGPVDVKVEATMTGFARLCFGGEDADDLVFKQVLKLSGDSETMLRFKKMLTAAELDWEQELRHAFGDFFGDKVMRFARGLIAAEQQVTEQSRQLVNNGLRQLGTPDEDRVQTWQAGVEFVARKLPALQGRITKLEHRVQALIFLKDGA
ncbi:MAG: SCP2 sterol-binding domain-containing protein [Mariprofundales bacterium]|nr:SCP2 sterol-binding domain-containing protein [Mariprofundales bacterium]